MLNIFQTQYIYQILIILFLIFLKIFYLRGKRCCKLTRDMKDDIIIITGCNTGIGKQTAIKLAQHGATIIFACRNEKKALEAINDILLSNKTRINEKQLLFIELDLSDADSIQKFAYKFKQNFKKLDILINNAGVYGILKPHYTKQGIELTFGVNHCGHFLLTQHLLDVLTQTPKSRILTLSSVAHWYSQIDFEALLQKKQSQFQYNMQKAYSNSKTANIYFASKLQKLLDKKFGKNKYKSVAVHPGWVRTEMNRHLKLLYLLLTPIYYYFYTDSFSGAQTTLECCYLDFDQLQGGKYYSDCQVARIKKIAQNVKLEDDCWNITKKITKLETDFFDL